MRSPNSRRNQRSRSDCGAGTILFSSWRGMGAREMYQNPPARDVHCASGTQFLERARSSGMMPPSQLRLVRGTFSDVGNCAGWRPADVADHSVLDYGGGDRPGAAVDAAGQARTAAGPAAESLADD